MSIEAINSYEDSEIRDRDADQTSSSWNGREVTFSRLADSLDTYLAASQTALTGMTVYGSYIIGNVPIGYCLQGHVACHKYLQDNYRPILLCDAVSEKCPFEFNRFMRYVNTGER